MTVTELLYGAKQPLSNIEFIYWQAYIAYKGKLEEEANKKAQKKNTKQGPASQEFKRTMGTQN